MGKALVQKDGKAERPGMTGNIVTSIDHTGLTVRLGYDPVTEEPARKVVYFSYAVGKNIYTRPCRSSLGIGPNPTAERMKELYKERDELKAAGKTDSKEYVKADALVGQKGVFKPRNKFYLFGFYPGETQLRAIKVSPLIIDQIWGRKATTFRKACASLQDALLKDGIHIFMTGNAETDKTGWVKMWRTGEKLGTDYHIALEVTQETDDFKGKQRTFDVPLDRELPAVLYENGLDEKTLPDPVKFETQFAWSEQEEADFVKNNGVYVPQRILDQLASKNSENSENVDEMDPIDINPNGKTEKGAAKAPNLDEIPFR